MTDAEVLAFFYFAHHCAVGDAIGKRTQQLRRQARWWSRATGCMCAVGAACGLTAFMHGSSVLFLLLALLEAFWVVQAVRKEREE